MQSEKQKLFSLAAVVVAAVLFGMVIAGGLDLTPAAVADRPAVEASAPVVTTAGVPDFVSLADRVVPSVVSVYSTEVQEPGEGRRMPADPFHFFFGPRGQGDDDEPSVRRSSGSGFFISPDGEILTNNHVVEDADKIEIQLADDSELAVEVVGRDPETDLALLKVVDGKGGFPYLELGDSSAVRVGEWVMAVGNPLNMDHTVTVGVVSAKGRVLGLSDTSFENFIQTDAAINFGNSGGPLVNLHGQAVGINTAINARGQNLGFAVPINTAKRILEQLRERGEVVRGYLGVTIQNIDQDTQKAFGLSSDDGAFVVEVMPGYAADEAGIEHGDVIVTVDGEPIEDTRELIDLVSALPPGTEVALGVVRDGESRKVEVTLDERPRDGDLAEAPEGGDTEDRAADRVGIEVRELTPRMRQFYGVDDDVDGVVITSVRAVSPAGDAGLLRGDVITEANRNAVSSVDELLDEIDTVSPGERLVLYVYRPRADRSFFAILQLEE